MSSLMEEREELIMVSLLGGISKSRKSHFLKPIINPLQNLTSNNLSPHSLVQTPKNVPFKIIMKGGIPQKNWKKWVHQLIPLHQHAWKKAGIFEAILASTYKIKKQKRMFVALVERWCVETNTFVFPWGEATVTLEDLMVLGGFSVLGKPVFGLLDSDDMVATYNRIRADCNGKMGSYYAWLEYFMGLGGEMEHVAFLILWLSIYVFPIKHNIIATNVFPIAIHLSKGVQIALGPAVLASIYNDLSLLKRLMVSFSKNNGCGLEKDRDRIAVCSPLYFVHLWAWERFPKLRPNPSSIKYGEPRLARWDKLGESKLENFRELIDCSGESFQWRPYAVSLENWEFEKWYKADELYVLVDSEMEMDVEEFVRFVRVSELVGLDCVEHYAPHRVAMQFGFDQDIPECINRQNETPQMAWSYYNRPITSAFVYIPPKLFEASVSTRYFKWWYQQKLGAVDHSPKKRKKLSEVYRVKEEFNDALNIQNLGSSYDIRTTEDKPSIDLISSDEEDGLSISNFISLRKKQKVFEDKISGKTLTQCGTLSTSVLNDAVTLMDPIEVIKSDPRSTGTPKRDTVCVNVTEKLSGNLDHGEGDRSNNSDVEKNVLKCDSQEFCTLVTDQGGYEIKLAGIFEESETTREDGNEASELENMAANLNKSSSSSKDKGMGIRNYGGSEVTMKEIESRLSNLEALIRDLKLRKLAGNLTGDRSQQKPAQGS